MQFHLFQKRQVAAADHSHKLLIAVTNATTLYTRGLLSALAYLQRVLLTAISFLVTGRKLL